MKRKLSIVASVMLTASLVVGSAPACGHAAERNLSNNFVRANGTHFELDGKPFYFAGANSYDLFTLGDSSSASTVEDICTKYMYPEKIDARMKAMADNGVTVIRTWGFSNESWHGFETAPGEYVEPQFMLFDYIMKSAREHGIKVIITLENYWEAYGGIDKKLSWAGANGGGNHKSRAQYFTNEQCKQWYKDYVKHFAERTNYFTGEKYKDDPTIFAWDLMNEPRYQDAGENETGETLRAWIDEMGAYVKSVDPNHMVCAGLEGHGTEYNFGGDEGNPFVYIQQSPYLDFCSAHPYPDEYWANLTPEQNAETVKHWIKDAHEKVGKPFVVGEFNVSRNLSPDKYEAYWRSVYDTIYDEDAAGALFWEFNDRQLSHFTVMDGDPILKYFKEISNKMTAKNGGTIVNRTNKLSVSKAEFDKANPKDITVDLTLAEGNSLSGLKDGSYNLVQGKDYTVNGNKVTINKSYLQNASNGNKSIVFDISSDNDPALSVRVYDSSVVTPEVPNAPENVKVTGRTKSSVSLSWSESSSNVASYEVYCNGTLAGTTYNTNYEVTGLNAGTEYKFTVVAVSNDQVKSDESAVVKATTDNAPIVSATPEWDKDKIYTYGDKVSHNGVVYTAQWWTKGEEPGTTGEWGVWRA